LSDDNDGSYKDSLTCEGAKPDDDGAFKMPDRNVTCTITNTWLKPKIDIKKQAWDTDDESSWKDAEKLENGADVTSGTTITWTYTVTNTGEVELTNITVSDDQLDDSSVTCPKTTLAVGEDMICTASGE